MTTRDEIRGAAREEILGRIRGALADRPAPAAIPRRYARHSAPGTDVVELFTARAADYHATVVRVSPGGLPAAIAAAAAGRRIAVPTGVPAGWVGRIAAVPDDPPLSVADLDGIGGVLTGAAVAIAETGTVILDCGPDQGRRALTLLPDLHLCVVRTGQIVGSVPEAVARLDPRRPLTWISGPSATSDIELDRVLGVHGPRNLHLLIADP